MKTISRIATVLALLASIIPVYAVMGIVLDPNADGNLLITLGTLTPILGGLLMGIVKLVKKSPKAATIYSIISLSVSAVVYAVILT
ncbi:hypothetical protein OXB14_012205 [Bacteroides hominis]|uniref:hypothetical protein n=1 Tax=Bacteroides hominis TaxID=2763023 RepID=UPI0022766B82|nr:hypothetical protein [Bacteroides fragilis]MCY2672565.1 hypothetical protein [Bacteroides fragilis]MDA1492802.1 hypothetical protein [Bacteroides fragilis]